jgi:TusA-related sulfurtransferase
MKRGEKGPLTVDAGELPLGGGLLSLLRPALSEVGPGGVVVLLSASRPAREDLPAWCRIEHHEHLALETAPDGRDRHVIRRGRLSFACAVPDSQAAPPPVRADPATGFAPRGARIEPGGPAYPFSLLDRDHVAPPEVGQLYAQASAAQWSGADIPWQRLPRLPDALSAAVGQVMTFLAMNEFSALYVPARFLPRIHPAYAEVALFLASQLADEARHIDVFLQRARLAGDLGIAPTLTSHSLLTLLQTEDFTEASLLLSVLGEGTFLDLLRYLEEHAPDEVTAEIVRRARVDEARHVHFGLAHVRHALLHEPALFARLEAAVRRRAAVLHGGVPAPIQDALTIYAAGGTDPVAIARGHETFRELLDTMRKGRVKRLQHAGFTAEQAEVLSRLHTPNFM